MGWMRKHRWRLSSLEITRGKMTPDYKQAEDYKACRLQLDLLSLVKFSTIVGLCSGTISVPLFFLLSTDASNVAAFIPFLLFIAPLAGALNGALTGFLGYPLYQWLSTRMKGQTYTGIFVGLVKPQGD
jgi:hypothetical protein